MLFSSSREIQKNHLLPQSSKPVEKIFKKGLRFLVHRVNEHDTERKIIFQAASSLLSEDSAETIAAKVLALEHRYFAGVIESLLSV